MDESTLHEYLLDRLVECRLDERYPAWVHALDPRQRGLPLGLDDHYVLDADDLRAAWRAEGFVSRGSGKAIEGRLEHGGLWLQSTRWGSRGTNELTSSLNIKLGRAGMMAGSLLHVLAAEVRARRGTAEPESPWARPSAYWSGDVGWFVARVAELIREVAAGCDRVGPPT